METWDQQEERNKRIGLTVAICIHAVILVLFFFMTAWEPPDPPIKKYGINLNYGTSETGSGEEQTKQEPSENPNKQQQPEKTEKSEQQPEPEQTEKTSEPASKPDQTESYEKSSPHTVEKKKEKEQKETEKKEKEKEQKEEPKEKKQDPRYQYPGDQGGGSSEGNDPDATGDKGKEEGDINESNIYKGQNTGKSGNARLEISGWTWVEPPKVKDKSDETGKVVINFRINSEGEIVAVEVVEKTVSASVAQVYKREIERTTFRKLNQNLGVQPSFEGKVTFYIRAR